MIDAVDHRLALGRKRCDDERHGRAKIRRHDGRALQLLHALDDRRVAVEADVRAEAREFD